MQQAQPTFDEVSQYYSAHASDYDEVQIRRLFIWKERENSKSVPLTSQAARAKAEQFARPTRPGTNVQKLSAELTKSKRACGSQSAHLYARRAVAANGENRILT